MNLKPDGQIKVITDYGEAKSEMRDAVLLDKAQKIADRVQELQDKCNSMALALRGYEDMVDRLKGIK